MASYVTGYYSPRVQVLASIFLTEVRCEVAVLALLLLPCSATVLTYGVAGRLEPILTAPFMTIYPSVP
jgi:hypothetical protein